MRRAPLLCLPLAALALAAPADAATVSITQRQDYPQMPPADVVRYDAQAGETNDLAIALTADRTIQLRDSGATIAPGAGCAAIDPHAVTCTATTGNWRVEAHLGDRDDRSASPTAYPGATYFSVVVLGEDGRDDLHGGSIPTVTLQGGAGDDTLTTGTAAYGAADGGDGNDVLSGSGALSGGAGADHLTAGRNRTSMDGGLGDDVLEGGPASDYLNGGGGHDSLAGAGGNDSLADGDGPQFSGTLPPQPVTHPTDSDVLDGGPGEDNVEYGARTSSVTVDLRGGTAGARGEGDRIANLESVAGGRAADHLTGTDGANRITGGGGHDVIRALGGDDDVYGSRGSDVALGAGDDHYLQSTYPKNDAIGRTDCGPGQDTVRYPDNRTRLGRGCEIVTMRSYATVRDADTADPVVQCGPFRRRPGTSPCTFRLRMVLPARQGTRYLSTGTPLGVTAWQQVPYDGGRRRFHLRLGSWGRAQLRARGSLPVRVILERRTSVRARYTVGSYVTVLR